MDRFIKELEEHGMQAKEVGLSFNSINTGVKHEDRVPIETIKNILNHSERYLSHESMMEKLISDTLVITVKDKEKFIQKFSLPLKYKNHTEAFFNNLCLEWRFNEGLTLIGYYDKRRFVGALERDLKENEDIYDRIDPSYKMKKIFNDKQTKIEKITQIINDWEDLVVEGLAEEGLAILEKNLFDALDHERKELAGEMYG